MVSELPFAKQTEIGVEKIVHANREGESVPS
jgi:hypothetical protein